MATSNRRPPTVTRTTTHEGGSAFTVSAPNELMLTAATTYLGEDTFYESAPEREVRLVELVHEATRRDPKLVADFARRLRTELNIRTASILVAVEYLRAGGPHARDVIGSVLVRSDEPAEATAYWRTRYPGQLWPRALRLAVGDGATRLYTERNYVKYGRNDRALFSWADVIALAHPKPQAPWQSWLFRFILDEAHNRDGIERYISDLQTGRRGELPTIYAAHQLGQRPPEARRSYLRAHGAQALADAGYPWESLSAWLPGGMDAEAWEAVIPTMGVMALLRNLRNFDAAGISTAAQRTVEDKITNPADVAASRIFPYRVWQAYKAAPSDRWKHPLATTLALAVPNLPSFDRTLFLVDVSGSMTDTLAGRSQVARYELATLMGVTAYQASTNSRLAFFASNSGRVEPERGASALGFVADSVAAVEWHISGFGFGAIRLPFRDWQQGPLAKLGQGTRLHEALAAQFDPKAHDRAIVFTDDQAHDSAHLSAHIPEITYFNLGGYRPVSDWGKRRYHVAGYSDAVLGVVAALD
jgi:hypothetical protein